jgi:hypothetical protein
LFRPDFYSALPVAGKGVAVPDITDKISDNEVRIAHVYQVEP